MEAVWIALGGNAVFLAVVAFLGQHLVAYWLNKDLGRFKDRLAADSARELEQMKAALQVTGNTEIERLKGELALISAEHSIMLSRLQDRRAIVIDAIYERIVKAIALTRSFVNPVQWVGEQSKEQKAGHAAAAVREADEYFEQKRVWLTESCAQTVETLVSEVRKWYNHFAVYVPYLDKPTNDRTDREKLDAWIRAWQGMSENEVPRALRALEAEMRGLLMPSNRTLAQPGRPEEV